MLHIAVVANNFQHGKNYIEYKFKDKIERIIHSTCTYILKNGDIIHNCHDSIDPSPYKGMVFDAFVIAEGYESLADIIKYRTMRGY